MNKIIPALLAGMALHLALPAIASENTTGDAPAPLDIIMPADGLTLDQFMWLKRPVIVFADSPADPRYVQQMQYISDELEALDLRDVVVITDTNPADQSALRTKLRPRGFMLVLIGKDGRVELRKPLPWSVRELSRSIDKMPMRIQEIRDRDESAPQG